MKIPLSRPDITQKEKEAVLKVLNTPHLSLGPELLDFEKKFACYIGVKYAIAVNSGTSGLHLCIKSLGIGEGNEVITTPFSFISSANCILFEKATPVFVDIKEDTLNINEDKIEEKITKKTKAILAVHVFGYPCDMPKIFKIAKKYKLAVIEDACEAIGAEINNQKVGSFGDCGVFAFYPNKQMTTGEGGMIVTNNRKIADLARSLRNQGRGSSKWLSHERLGYNYRLSEMNCALGIVQLGRIKTMLAKRAKVAKMYNSKLLKNEEIILPPGNANKINRSWFVYVVRLKSKSEAKRNYIVEQLRSDGIECGEYFPSIHLQSFYKEQFGFKKGDFPITEDISANTIALPFFNNLSGNQIKYVTSKIQKIILKVNK